MKTKWIKGMTAAGLVVFSFLLSGYMPALEPQSVLVEEAASPMAAHLNNRGVERYKQGQLQEALANFIIAAEMDETIWQGHYNCAVALIAAGKLREALHHLSLSMEIKPDNPLALRLYEDLLWRVDMTV